MINRPVIQHKQADYIHQEPFSTRVETITS